MSFFPGTSPITMASIQGTMVLEKYAQKKRPTHIEKDAQGTQ